MTGPITNSKGQIQKKDQNRVQSEPDLTDLLNKMGPQMAKVLPRHISPERMTRIVLTTLRMNPELLRCSEQSFLGSMMTAAQLGLESGFLGYVWFIPRKGHCQFMLGYQGMIELARRSGLITNIYACLVREGDDFEYELGVHRAMRHKPSKSQDREMMPYTHVYAVAHYKDRTPDFEVLSRYEVDQRRACSSSKDSGPWKTHPEAMTLKTAVRALWKWLPKSPEMARVDALENAEESGKDQSGAWDPEISEVLEKQGYSLGHDEENQALPESPENGSTRALTAA